MLRPFVYAYAHGFLSGAFSSKGRELQTRMMAQFGVKLTLLDLNRGPPEMLSHEGVDSYEHSGLTECVMLG